MANLPDSDFLVSLHNDRFPIGQLGDGAHYGVVRCTAWLNECLIPLKQPMIRDIGLIWHKFSNHNLIRITECILMHGLHSPVNFIGLQDNKLSIILSQNFKKCGATELELYDRKIATACLKHSLKRMEIQIGFFDRAATWPEHPTELAGIIPASPERVSVFLRNIDSLWQISDLKPFTPTPPPLCAIS